MKKLFLILTLIIFSKFSNAQTFAIHIDNGFSIYKFKETFITYNYKIGINYEQKIIKPIYLGSEINFFKSGYHLFSSVKYHLYYFEIPIFFRISIYKSIGLFGGFSNKILFFQIQELVGIKKYYDFKKYDFNRFVWDYYYGIDFKVFSKIFMSLYYFKNINNTYSYSTDHKKLEGFLFSLKYQIN